MSQILWDLTLGSSSSPAPFRVRRGAGVLLRRIKLIIGYVSGIIHLYVEITGNKIDNNDNTYIFIRR